MDVPQRTLIATSDPDLLDDLLRLAAAAATEVSISSSPEQALRAWDRAPLVVVGQDLERALRAAEPPPHPRVAVVSRSGVPQSAANGGRGTGGADEVRTADSLDCRDGTNTRNGREMREGGTAYLLPRDESALVDLFASVSDRPPAPVVSVVGGRGGAGASLLAVALSLAGERAGRSTALLDADPLGCGPDIYLGCDHTRADARTGWDDLLRQRGRMPWRTLRDGLPKAGRVDVLTWSRGGGSDRGHPLPVGAVRSALASARRGTDLVVVDLPRSFDPATTVFLNHSALVLVVVPADVYSVVSAARMTHRLQQESDRVRVVVRGARGGLSTEVVAKSLGVRLGADLPAEPGLSRLLRAGDVPAQHPRSPLARYADRVVDALVSTEEAR
ncbi:septum site-determining protein Ssd [Nocardiopsis metallicus]|uniref:Secretion/DNA translocation related CpaE-like protein n=1 Tax=Nocardiopsis metallicus TaxID=179819 RepID=A0A840WPN8_9ACTN|nr:septum site-determining protein Ssd [Nocardiopsis metallicus]MBB5493785.1 secretion/DNA translocation related CpaE-like protein [Nocardiopsis metallicus]